MTKKFLIIFLVLNTSISSYAQCMRGVMSIFEDESISNFIQTTSGKDSKAGAKCLEKIGGSVTSESYCECVNSNPKADFDKSRKLFRKKLGIKVKSSIFKVVSYLKFYDQFNDSSNQKFKLNCNFAQTLNKHCSEEFISEMFSGNSIKDLSSEIKAEFSDIYNTSKFDKSTINQFRTNQCTPLITDINNDEGIKDDKVQENLDKQCLNIEEMIGASCQSEGLTFDEKDTFEFDILSEPSKVDHYNYYCKIFDGEKKSVEYDSKLEHLIEANKNKDSVPESYCLEVCQDKAPYSFRGCIVNQESAQKALKKYNCIDNNEDTICEKIIALIGDDIAEQVKLQNFNEDDVAYLKDYLDEEDFKKVISINQLASSSDGASSFVDQFFATQETKSIVNDTGNTKVASNTTQDVKATKPEQVGVASKPIAQGVMPQNQAGGVNRQQQLAQQVSGTSAGKLTMGSGSRRGISKSTKQMVASIKSLRKVGNSLADAIKKQDKIASRRQREREKRNREKYQRYNAKTLEPIEGRTKKHKSDHYGPTRVATNSAYSSGGSNLASAGGATAGSTGSSTFKAPEAKATVVDITGRSAPNLNLANLKNSGATLPASITNHPDASEISKLFNGLEYEKSNKRGPASSSKAEIKKIKVDSSSERIDLGSLLINAKDIKPGDEFIIYKGDMQKFVKLKPAYTYRHGKKVFVGYRVENRSSKNADLAASIYAKKFLIL